MPSFFFHLAFDLDPERFGPRSVPPLDTSLVSEGCATLKTSTAGPINSGLHDRSLKISDSTPFTTPTHDWRYDRIYTQTISMAPSKTSDISNSTSEGTGNITNGISTGPIGLATKGRCEPCDPQNQELGWGVVRLYRDAEETPGLYDEPVTTKHSKTSRILSMKEEQEKYKFRDEDCTTLCILAVPSYLTPSDFLGFVGEKTRDEVSHFRMIRTERGNRYMVLMKFRNGKKAREWRRHWNGKAFDGMEVRVSPSKRETA